MRSLTAILVLLTCAMAHAEQPQRSRVMPEVVQGNNRFALDLYGALRKQPGNLFYSPGSISTALAMTYAGAKGETAAQMARVLHFDVPADDLHASFGAIQETLNANATDRGYRLSMANRLWGQQGYHFLPDFLAITRNAYGAELAQVDFARRTEQARQTINAWVEQQTQAKITNLIPPGALAPDTRLVLTNAIYFKGDWYEPFFKGSTQDAPFHVSARQDVSVPLMFKQDEFRIRVGDGLKMLELPYGKGDLSMVLLLPDKIDGLPRLEQKLSWENLSRWQDAMRDQEVRVHLPRFRMTSQFELSDILRSLGMTLPFDQNRADFSGMTSQEEVFLSAVIHKAYVDVNEEGTEAAAATAVSVAPAAAIIEDKPIEFRADHPFLFLIRDRRTGSILFLGRVTNPKE